MMHFRRYFSSSIKITNDLIEKNLKSYLNKRSYVEELIERNPNLNSRPRASILLPLYSNSLTNQVEILVLRRSEKVREHTGMIAFPGGMTDSTDIDAVHTAKREAEEEIGLSSSNYSILGCLPPITDSRAVMITPVVALLNSKFENFRLLLDETSEAFYLNLEQFLYRKNNYRLTKIGDHFVTHQFDIGSNHIWGVTAFQLIVLATIIYRQTPEFDFFRHHQQLDLDRLCQQLKEHFHLCISTIQKQLIKSQLDDVGQLK